MVKPGVQILFKDKILESVALIALETRIGRLADNEVVLDNLAVSRYHAKIVDEDGKFYLVDLGSSNGTVVNGSTATKEQIFFGDEIGIGKFTLRFQLLDTSRRDIASRREQRSGRPFDSTLMLTDAARLRAEATARPRIDLGAAKGTAGAPAPGESAEAEEATPVPEWSETSYALRVFRAGEALFEKEIAGGPVRIGRSAESDLILNTNDVSRFHAVVSPEEGRIVVEDLGSKNGTFVNGRKVSRAVLAEGDRIKLGDFEIVLAAAPPPAPAVAMVSAGAAAMDCMDEEFVRETSRTTLSRADPGLGSLRRAASDEGGRSGMRVSPGLGPTPIDLTVPSVLIDRDFPVDEIRVEVRSGGWMTATSIAPGIVNKLPPGTLEDDTVRVVLKMGERTLEKTFDLLAMNPAPESKPSEPGK